MRQLKIKDLRPRRKPIQEGETLRIELPYPVSVNELFNDGDIGHGKRPITPAYRAWRIQAGLEINRQHVGCILGPVELTFTVEDKPGRRDIDNTLKVQCDILVEYGIIEGDHSKIVRKITAAWGDVIGSVVEIRRAETK